MTCIAVVAYVMCATNYSKKRPCCVAGRPGWGTGEDCEREDTLVFVFHNCMLAHDENDIRTAAEIKPVSSNIRVPEDLKFPCTNSIDMLNA